MAKFDEFDAFGDTTPPVSESAETPPELPARGNEAGEGQNSAQGGSQSRRRPSKRGGDRPDGRDGTGRGGSPLLTRYDEDADGPAPLSAEERQQWRWMLSATAGKKGAADREAEAATAAWLKLLADARVRGVPYNMLVAAAAAADIDLPDFQPDL